MATKNQCIHCSVESCQHHETNDVCALTDIKVCLLYTSPSPRDA